MVDSTNWPLIVPIGTNRRAITIGTTLWKTNLVALKILIFEGKPAISVVDFPHNQVTSATDGEPVLVVKAVDGAMLNHDHGYWLSSWLMVYSNKKLIATGSSQLFIGASNHHQQLNGLFTHPF